MFSKAYCGEVEQYFEHQMILLKDRVEELKRKEAEEKGKLCSFSRILLEQKLEEISSVLAGCDRDEREALQFLYGAMPLSDLLNYPAAVYLAYARHGVYLWKEGPFAGKVPEKLFANYVLHYRVHNEDIVDTRAFFHDQLRERTEHKNMYDAAVETNYWCAEKATYQSTFMRTQNPLTMYGTAAGRCGEEAPFVVTALRSIGIPARGVSAPWWAHCDDNHAWVEAWCDGTWHFLGGCEPEESLDKGWFTGSTSRAMLIESRWFGKDAPEEPAVGQPDMAVRLNHLKLYSRTAKVTVRVTDEEGKLIPGARVEFAVLNYARFGSLVSLCTGTDETKSDYGKVRIDTGYGDLLVCAFGNGFYGEKHISLVNAFGIENPCGAECAGEGHSEEGNTGTENGGDGVRKSGESPEIEYTVVLRREMQGLDQWQDLDFHAPQPIENQRPKTEEKEKAEPAPISGETRLEAAARSRQERIRDFYRKADADRVLMRFTEEDRCIIDDILHQARGNMGEIVRFLEWDFTGQVVELQREYGMEHWKTEVLQALSPNDYWDIRAEVLAECCIYASPFAGKYSREVFFSDLLNPGSMLSIPCLCRAVLAGLFNEKDKEEIRKNPGCLPEQLNHFMVSFPKQEYANLVTLPLACLTGGICNEISRIHLCVQIYRALGIPARVRHLDRSLVYYKEGEFHPVTVRETKETGTLILEEGDSLKLEDWNHYSLSRFENGHFVPLMIRTKKEENTEGQESDHVTSVPKQNSLVLECGTYRLVTTNRLQNGNQLVKRYDFKLKEGEIKRIILQMREILPDDVLQRLPVEDLKLHRENGEQVMLSGLGGGKRCLILWLELTREPTEHILNEMYEKKQMFQKLQSPMYFVLRDGTGYTKDPTLMRTWGELPGIEVLFDEFGDAYENLSRQTGQNPGKLPLAVVLEQGRDCIFSDSGYNVGMADMLLRILE